VLISPVGSGVSAIGRGGGEIGFPALNVSRICDMGGRKLGGLRVRSGFQESWEIAGHEAA